VGNGRGGLDSGVGRIGIPSFLKDVGGTGLTTELAIANLVPKPGFTDFLIYIYDQNGLVQAMCEKLHEKQVEYLDVGANLAFLPEGFKGSAVISAVYWDHRVFDAQGRYLRNLVGLAAVKIERSGTRLGTDIPGDESSASEGFPILGRFAFAGPVVGCPGVPGGPSVPPGPAPWPTATTAPYPTGAPPHPTSVPPPYPSPTSGPPPPPLP